MAETETAPAMDKASMAAFVSSLGEDGTVPAATEAATETPAAEKPAEVAATETAAEVTEEVTEAVEEAPATAADSPDLVRARRILATANRKLARATATIKETVQSTLAEERKRILADPGKYLEELGLAPQEVLTKITKRDEPKSELEQLTATVQQLQSDAITAQVATLKANTQAQVTAAKERFPVIVERGLQNLVTDFMVEHYAQHAKQISWDRAAAQIEEFLSGKKPSAAKPPAGKVKPGTAKTAPVTLLNSDNASASAGKDDLPTDERERLAAVRRQLGI